MEILRTADGNFMWQVKGGWIHSSTPPRKFALCERCGNTKAIVEIGKRICVLCAVG